MEAVVTAPPVDERIAPPDPPPPAPTRSRPRAWLARQDASLLVLVAVVPAGIAFLLVLNRHQWFRGDEFSFLITRRRQWGGGDRVGALLGPHNEHWVTGAFVLYLCVFRAVRFASYVPYLLLVYVFHVVLVFSLRLVLLRAGITRWLATGAAVLLLVLGTGMENLAWGFQVGFVGGAALGMVALLLSDHDGPLGRRDGAGVALLLAALTFGPTALPLVVAVAVNAAWHRRWRAIAAYAGTAVVAFTTWYLLYGRRAPRMEAHLHQVVPYVWSGLTAAIDATTQLGGLGAAILVAAALVLVPPAGQRRLSGLVVATAAAAVTQYALAGIGRSSLGTTQAQASRYTYVAAALLLPSLLALLVAVIPDDRRAGPLLAGGFLAWALAGNISAGSALAPRIQEDARAPWTRLAATANLRNLRSMSPALVPDPQFNSPVDVAGLIGLMDHDGLRFPPVPTEARLAVASQLQVRPGFDRPGDPAAAEVLPLDGTVLTPEAGCVRLGSSRAPAGVRIETSRLANLVLSESDSDATVTLLGPTGERVRSPHSGPSLTLDHLDEPIEMTVQSSRALLCGVRMARSS